MTGLVIGFAFLSLTALWWIFVTLVEIRDAVKALK